MAPGRSSGSQFTSSSSVDILQDDCGLTACDRAQSASMASSCSVASVQDFVRNSTASVDSQDDVPAITDAVHARPKRDAPSINFLVNCADEDINFEPAPGATVPLDATDPTWQGLDPSPSGTWPPRRLIASCRSSGTRPPSRLDEEPLGLMAWEEATAPDSSSWLAGDDNDHAYVGRRRSSTGYITLPSGPSAPLAHQRDGDAVGSSPTALSIAGMWPALHPGPAHDPFGGLTSTQRPLYSRDASSLSMPSPCCVPFAAATAMAGEDNDDDGDEDDDDLLLSPRRPLERFPWPSACATADCLHAPWAATFAATRPAGRPCINGFTPATAAAASTDAPAVFADGRSVGASGCGGVLGRAEPPNTIPDSPGPPSLSPSPLSLPSSLQLRLGTVFEDGPPSPSCPFSPAFSEDCASGPSSPLHTPSLPAALLQHNLLGTPPEPSAACAKALTAIALDVASLPPSPSTTSPPLVPVPLLPPLLLDRGASEELAEEPPVQVGLLRHTATSGPAFASSVPILAAPAVATEATATAAAAASDSAVAPATELPSPGRPEWSRPEGEETDVVCAIGSDHDSRPAVAGLAGGRRCDIEHKDSGGDSDRRCRDSGAAAAAAEATTAPAGRVAAFSGGLTHLTEPAGRGREQRPVAAAPAAAPGLGLGAGPLDQVPTWLLLLVLLRRLVFGLVGGCLAAGWAVVALLLRLLW